MLDENAALIRFLVSSSGNPGPMLQSRWSKVSSRTASFLHNSFAFPAATERDIWMSKGRIGRNTRKHRLLGLLAIDQRRLQF